MRARLLFPAALALSACTTVLGVRELHYDENAANGKGTGDDAGGGGDDGPGTGDDGGGTPDTGPPCDTSKLDTDPANCGACGHDCVGGACNAGVCQPVAIVTTNAPRYVKVDATNIYFTDALLEGVSVMSKSTGAVKSVCSTPAGATGADELVIDATNAYFTFTTESDGASVGGIAQCPLAGGAGSVMVANQSYPSSLVLDGTTFYWAQNSSPALIMRRMAGTTTQIATGDTVTLAVLGGFLYVANDSANGTLKRCATGGACTLQPVASDIDGIDAVTLIGNNLLWGTGVYPGTIWQGLPDGGNPTKVTAVPPIPHTFAYDDKYFYWLNAGEPSAGGTYDQGAVQYCPHTNGVVDCGATGPRTLSTAPMAYVRGLVVDTNAVYWVDSSKNGGIWRVAKPL